MVCLLCSFSLVLSSCDFITVSSIVSAEINENGELILLYGDGSKQNLGVVVGEDGEDGTDGKDGTIVLESDGNSIAMKNDVSFKK